jgi:hypothetical protein
LNYFFKGLCVGQGKELVESESNKLENNLLQKFTKASGAGDYAKMKAHYTTHTRHTHDTHTIHTRHTHMTPRT